MVAVSVLLGLFGGLPFPYWCLERVEATVGMYLLASPVTEGASRLEGNENT